VAFKEEHLLFQSTSKWRQLEQWQRFYNQI